MLIENEKEELRLYKLRLKAALGGFLFFMIISLFILFVFKHESTKVMYKAVIINFLIITIIELVILRNKDHKAYSRLMGIFFFWYSGMVCIYIGSLYAINTTILKWEVLPNIIIYSLGIAVFITMLLYDLKKVDFIEAAVKEGKLDLEQRIYSVFQKGHTEVIKKSGREGAMMGLLAAVTPVVGVGIIFALGFEVDELETKQLIRAAILFVGIYLMSAWTATELAKAIQFYQYEKKTGQPIYTGLIKYIRREDEINQWRKERGLKPIKIKSLFFFGDIEN